MKNKGWAIGIIVAGVLYIGVILFTAAAYFTSLITSALMSGSGQVLTQDQAVMLTKQASELHYEAVLYTNEALNPDANKKTYQEWRQDVETATERWDQLGDVNDLLQYNSGIEITSHKSFGEFFSALWFKKKIWFAGMG